MGEEQYHLIDMASELGRPALAAQFMALLDGNLLPRKKWEIPYQNFEALCAARSREAAKQKNTEEIPDTVPGSGSGLREDYDDLEDLHEDGNYKDLNEEQNE